MREDWIECTLGDFIQHRGESLNPKNHLDETLELYSVPNHAIKKPEIKLGKNIGSSKQVVENNWVLLSRINPHLNRSWVIKSDSDLKKIASSEWVKFPPNDALNPDFIGHFLTKTELKNYMCLNVSGVGGSLTRTNKNAISIFKLPLPPIVEQKAIVKKIEELFSSLDSGIIDLKKAQEQLVIYRQAVLKKAFEGIKEFKPLKDCGEWKGGGTPSRQVKEYWENGKIPWVSSRDVKTKEIHDTERHITELAIPNSSTKWIEKDSLLFVMRSGILRRIFPISIAKTKLCVNQDIQTVSLDANWNTEYVYWFLQGNESDIRHSCSKDGTTVESIDANSLKAYLVPFCSLKEQHQIVQEIESRLSVCDTVEKDIADSLEKAQALRQSILKKAFEGKLLNEEEIAKCKADKVYEPASVLLERIKKEKKKK